MKNPRFRTAQAAGKYAAALACQRALDLSHEAYGSIPETIPNPDYTEARYEVRQLPDPRAESGSCHYVLEIGQPKPSKLPQEDMRPAREWYGPFMAQFGLVILLATGWDDVEDFNEAWNHTPISQDEFLKRAFDSKLFS